MSLQSVKLLLLSSTIPPFPPHPSHHLRENFSETYNWNFRLNFWHNFYFANNKFFSFCCRLAIHSKSYGIGVTERFIGSNLRDDELKFLFRQLYRTSHPRHQPFGSFRLFSLHKKEFKFPTNSPQPEKNFYRSYVESWAWNTKNIISIVIRLFWYQAQLKHQ